MRVGGREIALRLRPEKNCFCACGRGFDSRHLHSSLFVDDNGRFRLTARAAFVMHWRGLERGGHAYLGAPRIREAQGVAVVGRHDAAKGEAVAQGAKAVGAGEDDVHRAKA